MSTSFEKLGPTNEQIDQFLFNSLQFHGLLPPSDEEITAIDAEMDSFELPFTPKDPAELLKRWKAAKELRNNPGNNASLYERVCKDAGDFIATLRGKVVYGRFPIAPPPVTVMDLISTTRSPSTTVIDVKKDETKQGELFLEFELHKQSKVQINMPQGLAGDHKYKLYLWRWDVANGEKDHYPIGHPVMKAPQGGMAVEIEGLSIGSYLATVVEVS